MNSKIKRTESKSEVFNIDGIRMRIVNPDLDKDGTTGGIEDVERKTVEELTRPQTKSDMGEAVAELNKDRIDDSRLSTIDFLSRIDPSQYHAMCKVDALIGMKFLPTSVSIVNRSLMRKSVSIDGKGRQEYVQVVSGQQEKQQMTAMARFKNWVGVRPKDG